VLCQGLLRLERRSVLRQRERVGVHQVGDGHALDPLGDLAGDDRAAGGLTEEDAQEGEPDAVDGVAVEADPDAEPDQCVAEQLADPTRHPGGAVAITRHLPRDRPSDAAAVEREGGDQVEDEEDAVDDEQPAEQRDPGRDLVVAERDDVEEVAGRGQERGARQRDPGDQQRDQRPGRRNSEVLAG
jgi:hypothetical protein